MSEKRSYSKKGNPFLRGNTWTFIYYVTNADGTKTQRWKGGYKTKKEAEEDLKVYKAKSTLRQTIPVGSMLLKDYLEKWFTTHKKMIANNTINGYNVNIHNHIIPAIGNIKLKNVKPTLLEGFYADLLNEKKLSPTTIKYVHNVLKVALKDAVNDKLIDSNPCLLAKRPKCVKYKSKLLTQEEMQTLFDFIKNNRYEVEIKLAAVLGLRRGEVLGIKESDLDTTLHTLHIQRQVTIVKDTTDTNNSKNNKINGIAPLKSESSDRILFISEDVENLLLRKIEFNKAIKKQLGNAYHDEGLINCSDDGTPMSPQTLYHAFKRILKACGLPNVRFHDLRHSYATMCIDLNIPLKVISQNLGHSSTAVTDEVYADSIKAKASVADIIARNLHC